MEWERLGFEYRDTGKKFRAYFKDGEWSQGAIEEGPWLRIHEAATSLHYSQEIFEGLKAYRTRDGKINLFRPMENAKRMQVSAKRMLMEPVPLDLFMRGVEEVVKANEEWVPPYGTGATLYIRPFLIGVGPSLVLKPAREYIFSIYVTPVGPYFKDGLKPAKFLVSDYDRAAPNGTGAAKTGGNYAASLIAGMEAQQKGYADAIYLDPASKTKIEEVGAANFFGITYDKQFVTPVSPSILASITKDSLLYLAKEYLHLETQERPIFVEELDDFIEAGAMGTAAVVTPIAFIDHGEKRYRFYSETQVGPITQQLYQTLVAIQQGDLEGPEGWVHTIK